MEDYTGKMSFISDEFPSVNECIKKLRCVSGSGAVADVGSYVHDFQMFHFCSDVSIWWHLYVNATENNVNNRQKFMTNIKLHVVFPIGIKSNK